jgi:hypothetical protein
MTEYEDAIASLQRQITERINDDAHTPCLLTLGRASALLEGIDDDTALLRQALEALEAASSCLDGYYVPRGKTNIPEAEEAIAALRERLGEKT